MEKKLLTKRKLLRTKPLALDWGTCGNDQGWSGGEVGEGGQSLLVTLSSIYMCCAHRAQGLFLWGLESH